MSNEQCVHHWVVDEFNVGRCIRCGAVRDFGALMNKDKKFTQILYPAGEHGGKRGRKKKQATSKP
ncbi:hypothetical protein ES703_118740 [subsurface metagenome]